jgi:dephospho-CoA kinase
VGAIGSGKTEAARILAKSYNYKMISSGKILQSIMQVDDIETLGRSKFQDLAYDFITKEEGPSTLANKIIETIEAEPGERFVIDGIRNLKTFDRLKERLGKDLTLIYVDSTVDNCFTFFNKREGQTIGEYEFYSFLNHQVESEINKLIGKANIVFYNHGSKSSFEKEIKSFFKTTLD